MGSGSFFILASLVVAMFFALMFFAAGDRNKIYIKYILLAFPFVAIDLFPRNISTTIFDFITLVFVLFFYKPKTVAFKDGKTYFYLFVFLTIVAIAGVFNAERVSKDTAVAFLQYMTTFCFAKILTDECLSDHTFFFSVVNVLKITLVVSLLFLVCQFLFSPSFSFERSPNNNVLGGSSIRYPSFFQDPQKYAQFLSVSSLLLLVKKDDAVRVSFFNLLLLLASIVAMMFTGGRAGFGGWCLGGLILLLFGGRQLRLAIIVSGVLLYIMAYNYAESFVVFSRLTSLNDDYELRFSIWKDAYGIFRDNPVLGIGIGNYAKYVSIHNPDQFWIADNNFAYFDHPESGYLKFLTEFGLPGFVTILALIVFPVIKAFRLFSKTGNRNILVVIAALASWMVGFYTLYSFDDTRIRVLIITVICLLVTGSKWSVQDDQA